MASFAKSSTQYTTFEPRYDADGKVWRQVQAHGTLTALTPYKIIYNEYGAITAALADDTKYYRIGVPVAAAASGDIVWVQTGGYIEDVITPSLSMELGHGLEVHDGAIADLGADYSGGDAEFAVAATATTSSTTQDLILVDRVILAST